VPLRALDKLPTMGQIEEREGPLKATFGSNGTGKFSVTLQTDSYMIGEAIRLRIIVMNANSKLATDGIKVELHRDMKI